MRQREILGMREIHLPSKCGIQSKSNPKAMSYEKDPEKFKPLQFPKTGRPQKLRKSQEIEVKWKETGKALEELITVRSEKFLNRVKGSAAYERYTFPI